MVQRWCRWKHGGGGFRLSDGSDEVATGVEFLLCGGRGACPGDGAGDGCGGLSCFSVSLRSCSTRSWMRVAVRAENSPRIGAVSD
jgi:hypothetical protein